MHGPSALCQIIYAFLVVEAAKIEFLLLSFGDVKIRKRMNGRYVFSERSVNR